VRLEVASGQRALRLADRQRSRVRRSAEVKLPPGISSAVECVKARVRARLRVDRGNMDTGRPQRLARVVDQLGSAVIIMRGGHAEGTRRTVSASLQRWAGVDVGASKGFDIAVIDRHGVVAGPERITEACEVVRWLRDHDPRVVAVDSPRSPAHDTELFRPSERELVRAGVCCIRYTPNERALAGNAIYYAWIANGFKLYAALTAEQPAVGWEVIECFPTATWARLGGPRGKRSRARWSRKVLEGLALGSLPSRMNQDARDAIGAALTARLHDDGKTEVFGDEIVVPVASTST
jgi:predicted nuclease with RNAse H fold